MKDALKQLGDKQTVELNPGLIPDGDDDVPPTSINPAKVMADAPKKKPDPASDGGV